MGIELLLEMTRSADEDRVLLGSARDGLTAREVDELSAAGARHLVEAGVRSVAFLGLNGPVLPVLLLAAARANVAATPLNYRLSAAALGELLLRLDAPLVIVDEQYASAVPESLTTLGTDAWLALCRAGADGALPPPAADDDVAVTLFTSGTTATPKSVLLRHGNLTSYVLQTVEFASADPADATLVSVPPYHVAGVGSVLSNLYAGRRVAYLPNFTAADWVELVRAEEITTVMLVPTMLSRIVEHLEQYPTKLPSLRRIAYGGAKMARPTLERALDLFAGVDFANAYGLTETSSTIAVLGPEEHRRAFAAEDRALLSSAGRFVPGVEGEIRSETGAVLAAGETGELWVRGPQVSGEYAGTGSALDAAGWFPTRDLAHLDAEGYLFLHGRTDDTIIRGGENIAPGEIEDVLLRHPEVADAGVLGVPDPDWGQRIRAVVVLRAGATDDPESLRAWVRARLRGSRTPDEVVIVPALPYSPTGKLLRSELAS
ncbi:fatty acid--CoA ligase family protein [Amycolatopsis rhabdoformis]|uniref:Fatty acid--CoA ligase family protein n=1 Tax=Amycolatopsis rhabdoformis TaxID=1448059 RepID=A0ABZ1IDM9_9PSEU|nr:fatty acid--CoA ligase family protein [Amycolatopsis rhabdoformis]WSE32555.1 fatty acid--CoA ligase family protein [Amycolatopsis rhabdoformis]